MKSLLYPLFLFLLAVGPAQADSLPGEQDPGVLVAQARTFLTAQASHLPGQATISVRPPDPSVHVAACPQPETFLPGNSRLWGRTLVGLRCTAPQHWTLYLTADIAISGDYLVSTGALTRGHVMQGTELTAIHGELTRLPSDIVTDPASVRGKILAISIPAGTPLRLSVLRAPIAFQPGQPVRLVSEGHGFEISANGRAVTPASVGQTIEVRVDSGQIIHGIADNGGIVRADW